MENHDHVLISVSLDVAGVDTFWEVLHVQSELEWVQRYKVQQYEDNRTGDEQIPSSPSKEELLKP